MKSTLSLMLVLSSLNISAGVQRNLVLDKTINNTDCEQTDSCSLKKFSLQIKDYIVTSRGEKSYGTSAYISYETDKVDNIEKYAVVQFIKGCAYNESIDEQGNNIKRAGISRKFFGRYEKFVHKDWVIDSIDNDPIYNSSEINEGRHEYYRWNENPASFSEDGEHYVLRKDPTHPKVYVSDHPATSFIKDSEAKNTNLTFKTCIYKTSETPRELGPSDIDFADPIHCIEWKSSYVYDFKTSKFERNKTIENSCNDLVL